MEIEHAAIWVKNLEKMKHFYESYFNGNANAKYHNKDKQLESYFIKFEGRTRLEIMRQIGKVKKDQDDRLGLAHLAFSLGSRERSIG